MGPVKKKNPSSKANPQRGSQKSRVKKKVNTKTAAKAQKTKIKKIKKNAQLPKPRKSPVSKVVYDPDSDVAPKKYKNEKPGGRLRERMQ